MSLYTKTGDDGETGLFGNRRVAKDSVRIEAYGTIDELNSCLGLVRAEAGAEKDLDSSLASIQSMLFDIGADLATEGGHASQAKLAGAIAQLERWIDASEAEVPPLRSFVLPGGTRLAALLHLARCVCRRAERRYWTLAREVVDVPRPIGVYVNRLSDLLFSWARRANARAGRADVPWLSSSADGAS